MGPYKPGQSVRLLATASQFGTLINVSPLVATVHGPDGTLLTPAVVNDSTGNYHADIALATNAAPGTWIQRWQTTNAVPDLNALVEAFFIVTPLAF